MTRKASKRLHVFAGTFASREEACAYTEAHWEPEPGDEASDDEYSAWENRNPIWGLQKDLGTGLDSDFIETIDGDNRFDYLGGHLTDPTDLESVRALADAANTLVLIFPDALHDPNTELASTSQMTYCGAYEFRLK